MFVCSRDWHKRAAFFGVLCSFLLQIITISPAATAQMDGRSVDIFGNPICIVLPDTAGELLGELPGERDGHGDLLSCCDLGCTMFQGLLSPRETDSISARYGVLTTLAPPPGFDRPSDAGATRTIFARAPPLG